MEHEDAPPAANRAVKLLPFWTGNPRAWLTSAEGAFRLRNIADEESRFFNCLHALPEAIVSLIADLVEADQLHASTACKAHPVGYRDIPRSPLILHMAETFSSAHIPKPNPNSTFSAET